MRVTLEEATKRGGVLTKMEFARKAPMSFVRLQSILNGDKIDTLAVPKHSRGKKTTEQLYPLADQLARARKLKKWSRGGIHAG